MNKRILYALLIIGIGVIVLIFNSGNVEVNILFTEIKVLKSLAFLGFATIGVLIGVLIK